MNLILLFDEDFVEKGRKVRLYGRRLKHVLDVHRASVGDELHVGLLNGPVGRGVITGLGSEGLDMDVLLDKDPPPSLPLTLIFALPRPKMLKRVLFSASSMGVKRIHIINSFRVEKSFWQSPVLRKERLKELLVPGLEQSRDTIMPEVFIRPLFRPFVEDELPALIRGTISLVAHPGAEKPCLRNACRPVTLAVGPEGGFIPYEIEKLQSIGFSAVSIGERSLRVETVVPALLARLF